MSEIGMKFCGFVFEWKIIRNVAKGAMDVAEDFGMVELVRDACLLAAMDTVLYQRLINVAECGVVQGFKRKAVVVEHIVIVAVLRKRETQLFPYSHCCAGGLVDEKGLQIKAIVKILSHLPVEAYTFPQRLFDERCVAFAYKIGVCKNRRFVIVLFKPGNDALNLVL